MYRIISPQIKSAAINSYRKGLESIYPRGYWICYITHASCAAEISSLTALEIHFRGRNKKYSVLIFSHSYVTYFSFFFRFLGATKWIWMSEVWTELYDEM